MINLKIGNSYSYIDGLNAVQEKQLRKLLSYSGDSKAAYFSGGYTKTYCLLNKKGEFPTGLLSRVLKFLNNIDFSVSDIRVFRPTNSKETNWIGPEPHEWQKNAVQKALLRNHGIISAPTGTGKSLVIAALAHFIGGRTLIVVPTLEIKKQLTAGLLGILNHTSNITIENIDSSTLKTHTNFDTLIIDEAHHAASKTYRKMNRTSWTKISRRFFLTATPFRNQKEEMLLFESIAGEVIYKLQYKEAIAKRYIVPIEAYYITIPKQDTDAYTWAEVYKELIVENRVRNDIITKLLCNLVGSDKSTLCLIREIEHGNALSVASGLQFVNGQDDFTRGFITAFNQREIKGLIGTTGVLGEGIDSRPCEFVIIAGAGKAKSQFMQQCGRALRNYPGKESAKIILIKDKSHRFLSRHFKEQCAILKEEYGITPLEIKL